MKIVLTIFAMCSLPTLAMAQTAAPSGDAKNGERLFLADGCYECHGTVGQGSRGTGPRLAPNTIPFEAFSAQLRKPSNVMPPYTALVVSDTQLGDIYAYLRGLPGPARAEDAAILQR